MAEYAYDFDADDDRIVLCDAPDGSIGVWNTGIEAWQGGALAPGEIEELVAAGTFRWRLRALRDRLQLDIGGPFADDGAHTDGTAAGAAPSASTG